MMKKFEYYYDKDDHEKIDILDLKIYWDTNKNQFRHKFNCCSCKKYIGCRCFDTLESALQGVDGGIICEECGISNALNELSTSDIMDLFDQDRWDKALEYLESIITKDELDVYMTCCKITDIEDVDYMEVIEDSDKDEIFREYCINLLTEEEKWDQFIESCDGYLEGESCEI